MVIYLDLLILLNFLFNTILLIVVKLTLKRNTKFYRLALAGLFGGFTILFLLLPLNNFELFFLKVIVSLLMLFIAFGYQSSRYFFKNTVYLYLASMLLGGFLYFLNLVFAYHNQGLVFFHQGLGVNFLFLLIFSPIILYIYIKSTRNLSANISNYQEVEITFKNNKTLKLIGLIDTGNYLKDPITNKNIILVEKAKVGDYLNLERPLLVPYKALNHQSILKCFPIKQLNIAGKKTQKVLIGLSENKFKIDGIECILNNQIMEELKCLKK